MTDKWQISSWGEAQGQIRKAIHFLCRDKIGVERTEVTDEIIALVRAIGRGEEPGIESNPLLQRDEHERESWARGAARQIVGGAMRTSERLPATDQAALLYEIAKWSLWHVPNSRDEVRRLLKFLDLENIKQPHPKDTPPGRDELSRNLGDDE